MFYNNRSHFDPICSMLEAPIVDSLVQWQRQHRTRPWTAAVLVVCMLGAGCSNPFSDKGKLEDAINKGIAASPTCMAINNVQTSPATRETIEQEPITAELLRQGLIVPGVVSYMTWGGRTITGQGYVFSEAAKALVNPITNPNSKPCFQYGHWKVAAIEAIDRTTDASGKPIANVRASIQFIPAEWYKTTRSNPAFADTWKEMESAAHAKFLFKLIKSGDEYFYTDRGERIGS